MRLKITESKLYNIHWTVVDEGDAESGPSANTGVDQIEATSEEDACRKWRKMYGYQFGESGYDCWAEESPSYSKEEIKKVVDNFDMSELDGSERDYRHAAIKVVASLYRDPYKYNNQTTLPENEDKEAKEYAYQLLKRRHK